MSLGMLIIACLALLGATPLAAQQASLQPGQRIRVRYTDAAFEDVGYPGTLDGTLVSATSDSLVLDVTAPTARLALSWHDVKRVELFRGMGRSGSKGFMMGAVVGGAIGTVASIGLLAECGGTSDEFMCPSNAGAAIGTVVLNLGLFGGICGGIGAAIGSAVPREKWEKVGSLPFVVVPTVIERQPGIALSIPF